MFKYVVVKTETPDWCTGTEKDVKEFDNVEEAFDLCEKLEDDNNDYDIGYSVVVRKSC